MDTSAGKYLFLDFDGVLNSEGMTRDRRPASPKEMDILEAITYRDWFHHKDDLTDDRMRNYALGSMRALNGRMVQRLNRLVGESGARVVVSSNWRHTFNQIGLQFILNYMGFTHEVYGVTPRMSRKDRFSLAAPRCEQISDWLQDRNIGRANLVVLDDLNPGPHPRINGRWVRVHPHQGLTDPKVDEALKIFQEFT